MVTLREEVWVRDSAFDWTVALEDDDDLSLIVCVMHCVSCCITVALSLCSHCVLIVFSLRSGYVTHCWLFAVLEKSNLLTKDQVVTINQTSTTL